MDAIVGLWLCSIFGAVAFCAAGYLFGRNMHARPDAQLAAPGPATGELDSNARRVLESERDTAMRRAANLSDELRNASAHAASIEQRYASELRNATAHATSIEQRYGSELAAAKSEQARLGAELARAKKEAADARGEIQREVAARRLAEGRADDLTQRVSTAEKALARAESTRNAERAVEEKNAASLRDEVRALKDRIAEVDAERKRLGGSKDDHAARVRQLETELARMTEASASDRRVLEDAQHEGALREEQLKTLRIDVERARDEIARLRNETGDAQGLRAENARLEHEIQKLRATGFAASAAVDRPSRAESTRPVATDDVDGNVLQRMVDRVAGLSQVRAAVVTDRQGFVVAGNGEYSDALAAFGAFITDAGSKAERLLPLGAAWEVSVRDRQGVVLAARTLDDRAESDLALVTLGIGDHPSNEVSTILEQTPRVGL